VAEFTLSAHGASYRIQVDPDSLIGSPIAEGVPYESALLEHIHGLNLSGLAVDVGASIGNHSLWLAAVCGLSVIAFEPVDHRALAVNVAVNDLQRQIRVLPVALGARRGAATYLGKGRLKVGGGLVPVRRLDCFDLARVSVLKIDVEGMEPAVLRGAEGTIRRDRPLIFAEAWDEVAHEALAAVLEPWGYRLSDAFNPSSVATPVERWDP
jgi:FkbM family methyltransferase